MKQARAWFLYLLIFSLIIRGNSQENEEQVIIKQIIGKVEIKPDKSIAWRDARVNMRIRMKWDIRTYVESSCDLVFSSGTILHIGENTVVNLDLLLQEEKKTNTNVKVNTGQVWANIQKLINNKSSFSFETPTAVAAIRGTRLGIQVIKQQSIIDVYEGSVGVRNKSSKKELVVNTKNRAIITAQKRTIEIVSFDQVQKQSTSSTDSSLQQIAPPPMDPFIGDSLQPESIKTDTLLKKDILEQGSSSTSPTIDAMRTPIFSSPDSTLNTTQQSARKESPLTLKILQPANNQKIDRTFIVIQGITTPGAVVSCNSMNAAVRSDGSFTVSIPFADEEGEHSFSISARFGENEKSETRTIVYEPPNEQLFLTILSPQDGQTINQNPIKVSGLSSKGASVWINGKIVNANPTIIGELPIFERDIGPFSIEVIARDKRGMQEVSKTITVTVPNTSSQINTSSPTITIVPALKEEYMRQKRVVFMVNDKTPNDHIKVQFTSNFKNEVFSLNAIDQESITLVDGKNQIKLVATDLAYNKSNSISATVYVIPGPLSITVLKPIQKDFIVSDLPPMPSNAMNLALDVDIELSDGIGILSESIAYCKVNGIQFDKITNYRYKTYVPVKRGHNIFSIEALDKAGNRCQKTFAVRIND